MNTLERSRPQGCGPWPPRPAICAAVREARPCARQKKRSTLSAQGSQPLKPVFVVQAAGHRVGDNTVAIADSMSLEDAADAVAGHLGANHDGAAAALDLDEVAVDDPE